MKRSLLVEGNGVPFGVAVDGANRNDFKMLQATLEEPQHLCLDKGYDYDEVRDIGIGSKYFLQM